MTNQELERVGSGVCKGSEGSEGSEGSVGSERSEGIVGSEGKKATVFFVNKNFSNDRFYDD